jgi:hypothetical protein
MHLDEIKELEVCVRGKYYSVPSFEVNGKNIILHGRFIKVASVHAEEWLESEIVDAEECIRRLRETSSSQKMKADIFTFAQKIPNVNPKYRYYMELESWAILHLTTFDEWWKKLPQETRKNTRRAAKRGVVVDVKPLDDKLVADIMELNNSSPLRQGRANDHYGKSFEQVKKDQSSFPGRSDYICAYCDKELLGFIKTVRSGKSAAILQIITKDSAYDKRPGNALIVKLVQYCLEIGMEHLIYGKYVYGKKRTSSLIEFKKRHGFSEVLVPRYYVPLTVRGTIALSMNLHRELVGILPEKIFKVAFYLRERWYKLRLLPSRCSSTLERPNGIRLMERSIPPAGSSNQQRDRFGT